MQLGLRSCAEIATVALRPNSAQSNARTIGNGVFVSDFQREQAQALYSDPSFLLALRKLSKMRTTVIPVLKPFSSIIPIPFNLLFRTFSARWPPSQLFYDLSTHQLFTAG